ncbi:MAG: exodeoxyribonuclease VII small subunit [Thermoplasmata archaeon]|nr:MAG: exodeoxyribonuclease VII small subunit [Thermoplasmata archaeon]KAA0014077.1 MAG: exodeoxyribonuclease VII small subunit [Thermoplasmata archaeon]OYT61506.1 MAG: exodeoxyribonuclease VII small subunit [Thermoplasmatales archaeon ex4484_30]
MQSEGEEIKFEEALKKLEEIVEELEKGDMPLEETIRKFEEGIKLCKICKEKLEKAEMKIEKLMEDIK